jgi:hypothetical protein
MRVFLHAASPVAHGVPRELCCKPLIFLTLAGVRTDYSTGDVIALEIRGEVQFFAPASIRPHAGSLGEGGPSTRRTLTMAWLVRKLRIPATESNLGLVLSLCVVTMGLMSIAIVWQAQVIAGQREVIQWLEKARFGG